MPPRRDGYYQDRQQPLVEHLRELRDRLLRIVLVVLVIFLALTPFAGDLYAMLSHPLMAKLPESSTLIATEVAAPFLTPFKLCFVLAFFIGIPYILHQVWGFIAPALYRSEKRLLLPLLATSTVLFYVGVAFAYYVVFPLVFGFMVSITPNGVQMMTDIGKYLDFVLKMFMAFGIVFEVPIATILAVKAGIVTPQALAEKRPYIIVGSFVVGMLLTPPDILSQFLMAVPLWILFELGLFVSRRIHVPEPEEPESEEKEQAG